MCWAWGSLAARPCEWISVLSFLVPSFCRMAWPSAPERLRGLSSALKWFFWSSSRSSPLLAKATEAKLSDRATASSSTTVNFLDNFLHPFLSAFSIQAQAWYPSVRALGGLRPPVCLPSSVSRYLLANEHDAPRSVRCHRAFRLFHIR